LGEYFGNLISKKYSFVGYFSII